MIIRCGSLSDRASTRAHPESGWLQNLFHWMAGRHPLTFNGQTKSVTEWANELGISQTALSNRLSRGWPLERALSSRRKPKDQ
jgi:hypothetical protein